MISNRASYSTLFSTILRTSRYAKIGILIDPADAYGSDPLPKYLAKTKISFSKANMSQDPVAVNVEYLSSSNNSHASFAARINFALVESLSFKVTSSG
jgi:hypothetical protein